MEVRVRERLIGALVLVAIVVLLVPAILKGRDPPPEAASDTASDTAPVKRIELPIGDAVPEPEEQVLVPEPARPAPAGEAAATEAPATEVPAAKAPATPDVPLAPPPPRVTAKQPAPRPEPKDPAPPPAATAAPATAWAVQLGAFSSKAKAEQLVAELRKRRFAAFVLEYRASGQVLYRVRVGPEQDRARAEEIAARLRKEGFEPVVARHP
jgi:DedD protein